MKIYKEEVGQLLKCVLINCFANYYDTSHEYFELKVKFVNYCVLLSNLIIINII